MKGIAPIEIGGNLKTLIIVIAVLLFILALARLVFH